MSGSRDKTLRVWNIKTRQLVHLLLGHLHAVRCLASASDKIVSGSYDSTCHIWDDETDEYLRVLSRHNDQILAIAFDNIHVATGSLDLTVRLCNAADGRDPSPQKLTSRKLSGKV